MECNDKEQKPEDCLSSRGVRVYKPKRQDANPKIYSTTSGSLQWTVASWFRSNKTIWNPLMMVPKIPSIPKNSLISNVFTTYSWTWQSTTRIVVRETLCKGKKITYHIGGSVTHATDKDEHIPWWAVDGSASKNYKVVNEWTYDWLRRIFVPGARRLSIGIACKPCWWKPPREEMGGVSGGSIRVGSDISNDLGKKERASQIKGRMLIYMEFSKTVRGW